MYTSPRHGHLAEDSCLVGPSTGDTAGLDYAATWMDSYVLIGAGMGVRNTHGVNIVLAREMGCAAVRECSCRADTAVYM